jgi:hypothetical protein
VSWPNSSLKLPATSHLARAHTAPYFKTPTVLPCVHFFHQASSFRHGRSCCPLPVRVQTRPTSILGEASSCQRSTSSHTIAVVRALSHIHPPEPGCAGVAGYRSRAAPSQSRYYAAAAQSSASTPSVSCTPLSLSLCVCVCVCPTLGPTP